MIPIPLEAGVVLDSLMCVQLGLDGTAYQQPHEPNPDDFVAIRDPDGTEREWSPSGNLDDAFEAAAMVGLFTVEKAVLYCDDGDPTGWCVGRESRDPLEEMVSAPTPALAICKAILLLKIRDWSV